jgi:hypothetical protein
MGEYQQAPGAKDLWAKVVCGRWGFGWRMGVIPQHPLPRSFTGAQAKAVAKRWLVCGIGGVHPVWQRDIRREYHRRWTHTFTSRRMEENSTSGGVGAGRKRDP